MSGLYRRTSAVAAPGFIEPCLPTKVLRLPKGTEYVYELKLGGYRLVGRKAGDVCGSIRARGADFTKRFPRIYEAVRA